MYHLETAKEANTNLSPRPFEAIPSSHHRNMTAFFLTIFVIKAIVASYKGQRSMLPGGCCPPLGPHGPPIPNVGVFLRASSSVKLFLKFLVGGRTLPVHYFKSDYTSATSSELTHTTDANVHVCWA